MKLVHNINLKDFNTFKVQVFAQDFIYVQTKEQLSEVVDFSNRKKRPIFIIGQGSNILFTQNPQAIVVKLEFERLEIIKKQGDFVYVRVEAGKIWDDFVRWTVENQLYGLVNLSFIPGTVGAAPVQNIGAYGVEVGQFIENVEFFSIKDKKFYTLNAEQCQFSYRNSIFKQQLKGQAIITSVTFKLPTKRDFNLSYKDLQKYQNKSNLSLQLLRLAIGKIRFNKLPWPERIGNAGSFFKNPIISSTKAQQLRKRFPEIPQYPMGKNVKIPAGWLIDRLGLKGFKMGQAGVYEHNALVLVNLGHATGQEILKLAQYIQNKVQQTFGIRLEPEVNII